MTHWRRCSRGSDRKLTGKRWPLLGGRRFLTPTEETGRPGFVYDAGRVPDEKPVTSAGMVYAGLGYRADAAQVAQVLR